MSGKNFSYGTNTGRLSGAVTGAAVSTGQTKGRGSTTRVAKQVPIGPTGQPPPAPVVSPTPLNWLIYSNSRGPELSYGGTTYNGIYNTNFGSDSNGFWFNGRNTVNAPSYPVFTNFTISGNKTVIVSADFSYNDPSTNFGICLYNDGNVPIWANDANSTRISCQYNGNIPFIYGKYSATQSGDHLVIGNRYTCEVIYDLSGGNVTMNTSLKSSGATISSIRLNETIVSGSYRIGFTYDNPGYKTYITNLNIFIPGTSSFSSTLQNISISPAPP